jgi:Zn-dependent protease
MKKKLRIGNIGSLEISLQRNVFVGALILLVSYSIAASFILNYTVGMSFLAGWIAMIAHYASEFFHHLGHHWAARKTGYPMKGVLFIWVLAASRYPKNEPELPAKIHLQRAIGGPIASIFLGILFAVFAWFLFPYKNLAFYLSVFLSGLNMLIFGLGAFVPLGFTDGSTILEWWPKRGK